MTTTTASWPTRAELWLDDRGKGAWIAAMILGFVFFWPVGLALLAYMIWSKRMFARSCKTDRTHSTSWGQQRHAFRSSGNSAFDAYKADTLERLEREQNDFEAFLERLRASKDKQEFDHYLDDRAKAARDAGASDAEGAADDAGKDRSPARGSY